MQLGHDFISALNQIAEDRNLDPQTIATSLEVALASAYKRYQESDHEPEVQVNLETGDVIVNELRTVVENTDLLNYPEKEITISDARRLDPNAEIGDIIKIETNPSDFGRIAAQTARQVIIQRLKDAERQLLYSSYADKVGEMMKGVIVRTDRDQITVRLAEHTDAVLPKHERIPGEKYVVGDVMKFYVLDVRQMTRGPRIIVSRTHPGLLRKLMELEIPEVRDGIIDIRNIVREGGTRAKVAISTLDNNIDPVGACIGNGGSRIRAVSQEIRNEKIDIIVWSNEPFTYIKSALAPAQITKIEPVIDQENGVRVYVYPDQLSLAIGKAGQNVRLAARLTGWKIDIRTIEAERMPTLQDIFHDSI